MTKIIIFGLTSRGEIGQYEQQLGNVAILIPMIKMLREFIPDAEISTTIQLTDRFCMENDVTRIPGMRKLLPSFNGANGAIRLLLSFCNLLRANLWRFLKSFLHLNLAILIKGNRLGKFSNADVILDFNGDLFPSDVNRVRVLRHTIDVLSIRQMGIPVVNFVSSPGPFNTGFTRWISRFVSNRIDVFTNRDPISSEFLKQIGVNKTPIVNTACPAFLLEPASVERVEEITIQENIDASIRPLIGVNIAEYNLDLQCIRGKVNYSDSLALYVPMVKYLLDGLNANVFLLPHVYRVDPYTHAGKYVNGPDYDILLHLYKMVNGGKYDGRLRLVEGKYTASEAKGVIGQCDMYISGRLHAAVAALSQAVPTVLLAYGHKHHGFARLLCQERFVFEGTNSENLRSMVQDAWENRDEISKTLRDRMFRIRKLVNLNFEIIRGIVSLDGSKRNHIPKEISDAWVSDGEQI